jgi:hypothetical protein
MTDDEFLTAFEECKVERKEWTHEAHIRMAWLYLTQLPPAKDVFDRVRSGIKKLNATFARQRSPLCMRAAAPKDARGLTGYHETMTVAFVTVIASRIAPGEDFAAFRDHNPDLFEHNFPTILKHYSPARLYSPTAKKEFIEPDLIPLPLV